MKKVLRDANTAHWLFKAKSKNFAPPQTHEGQNLISWSRSLLHLQTQFGEDQCTQFQVIMVTDQQTNKQTHKHTHKQTGLITIHCAASVITVQQDEVYFSISRVQKFSVFSNLLN